MNTDNTKRKASPLPNQLDALQQHFGPIEHRQITSLARHENNPRKHPEKQLVKLTASIRQFGFAVPVLVDEYGTIIAGEARVEAAKRAGMTEVPVVVAHHWSTAQVRAYRLADNRLAELASQVASLAGPIIRGLPVKQRITVPEHKSQVTGFIVRGVVGKSLR